MNATLMKAGLTLAVLIAIGQSLATPVLAQSDLQVTFNSNPSIVAPGTNGYLMVNLRAIGDTASNIEITATSVDSNTILTQGNWDVTVGSIQGGSSYSVPYEFSVASTAKYGLYQITFNVYYSGGLTIHQTAIIQVQQPSFIDLSAVSPASVNIGQDTTVLFNFTNTGNTIYHVLFTWSDPNNLILPVGTDNRVTIPVLTAGNTTSVPVKLMASPSLSPGVYPLTITLKFFDDAGANQTVTSTIGMEVAGATTFEVVASQSSSGTTSLTIVNTGANTANSVIVTIPQQTGYQVVGTRTASLGNLDAGGYSLASFQVSSSSQNGSMPFQFNRTGNNPPSGGNQNFNRSMYQNRSGGMYTNRSGFPSGFGTGLTVVITYTDAFGIRETVTKQVSLSSSSSSGFNFRRSTTGTTNGATADTGSFSFGSGGGLTYIIIGVIGIILIAAVIYIGRKKKLEGLSRLLKRRKE